MGRGVTTDLHAHNHGIQIQHGLPVLPENIQADVPLEVDVGMIDLLRTLDLGRVMWEVLIDSEVEVEGAALVHALVGLDGENEVQDIVRIGEGHFHRATEGEFIEVCPSRPGRERG